MRKSLLGSQKLILIALLIAFGDQLSKNWITRLIEKGNSKVIVPQILEFTPVENTGAAFSLLSGATYFLGLLSLFVTIWLIIFLWRNSPMRVWKGLAIAFLLGGTIGNGLDRWYLGYVNDFIKLIPIEFPIFNLADISINLAIIFFLIDLFNRNNTQRQS